VTVSDTLPTELTFVTAIPSQGSCMGTETVICELGELSLDGTATVTLTTLVNISTTGWVENSVTIAGDEYDPLIINNTISVTVGVETGQFRSGIFLPFIVK